MCREEEPAALEYLVEGDEGLFSFLFSLFGVHSKIVYRVLVCVKVRVDVIAGAAAGRVACPG